MFRLLITGSRNWEDFRTVWSALNRLDEKLGPRPAVMINGGARGVDMIAVEHWTRALGRGKLQQGDRMIETHIPDWTKGRGAGIFRNQQMVDSGANLCFAFIHRESRGATHCANAAIKAGIKTLIWRE